MCPALVVEEKSAPQLPEFRKASQMIQLYLFNPVILKLTLEFLMEGAEP